MVKFLYEEILMNYVCPNEVSSDRASSILPKPFEISGASGDSTQRYYSISSSCMTELDAVAHADCAAQNLGIPNWILL